MPKNWVINYFFFFLLTKFDLTFLFVPRFITFVLEAENNIHESESLGAIPKIKKTTYFETACKDKNIEQVIVEKEKLAER